MSRLLLVSPTPTRLFALHGILGPDLLTVTADPLPLDPESLIGSATPPDVILLDGTADPRRALELAAALHRSYPASGVVLVSPAAADLSLDALRAGVRDVIDPDAEADEVHRAVALASHAADGWVAAAAGSTTGDRRVPTGRVIGVLSPKGGVGKTTVATNVAVGLALRAPSSTVIVDLDTQFGDVASALDLEPEFFLADTVRGAARRDPLVLKTHLTQHRTGLYAICAPSTPAEADLISADDVRELLATLAANFRYVVVDTAPGISEHTLAALDQTTDLVLVTSMDVPGVRGMRKELATLAELDLLPVRRQVVLNFVDRKSLLTVADVEATIGARVDVSLPRSRAALTAVNQGIPLLQSRTRDPLTKQLDRIVSTLLVDELAVPSASPASSAAGPVPAPAAAPPKRGRRPKLPAHQPRRAATRWHRASPDVTR